MWSIALHCGFTNLEHARARAGFFRFVLFCWRAGWLAGWTELELDGLPELGFVSRHSFSISHHIGKTALAILFAWHSLSFAWGTMRRFLFFFLLFSALRGVDLSFYSLLEG